MLEVVRGLPDQLESVLAHPLPLIPRSRAARVLVLGTGGGSAMAGEALRRLCDRPGYPSVDVAGEYRPPAWTGPGTLVLAASHSGNTKETVAAVQTAAERGAQVFVLTSGGQLRELARRRRWPVWPLTPGIMPRALLGEILAAMLRLLDAAGLYPDADSEIAGAARALRKGMRARETAAAAAAKRLLPYIPYVLGSEGPTAVCGTRLKNQLAENGKRIAFASTLPRAHHDEIVGWSQPKSATRRFGLVLLRDRGEDAETRRRFEATRALLKPRAGALLELHTEGEGLLERILTLAQTCDFLSVRTALLSGQEPTPVKLIDELKRRMGQ